VIHPAAQHCCEPIARRHSQPPRPGAPERRAPQPLHGLDGREVLHRLVAAPLGGEQQPIGTEVMHHREGLQTPAQADLVDANEPLHAKR